MKIRTFLKRLFGGSLAITSLLVIGGCKTFDVKPISAKELQALQPFELVSGIPDKPRIDVIIGITPEVMVIVGQQGGAIGGALIGLGTIIREEILISKRKALLGDFWEQLQTLDYNVLFQRAFETHQQQNSPNPWGGLKSLQKTSVISGIDHSQITQSTIVIEPKIGFSPDLTSVSFSGDFAAVWQESPGSPFQTKVRNTVHHIVFAPEMSFDSKENAEHWKSRDLDVETYFAEGYRGMLDVIFKSLTLPSYKALAKGNLLKVWGIQGVLADYESGKRLYLRNSFDEVFSLPVPPIAEMDVQRFAVLETSPDDKEILSESLIGILKEEGLDGETVSAPAGASEFSVLIKIYPEWEWNFGTYLKSVSIFLVEPLTDKLVGVGSAVFPESELRMFGPSDKELLKEAWEDAFDADLKAALNDLKQGRNLTAPSTKLSSPLGQ
jgi:hypothetical protein